MSKLLEFLLGSILITVFTAAFLFFFAIHYLLGADGIVDCTWHASARAWLDLNGDGWVNGGEPPLSDVEIHVDNVGNQLLNVSWPEITDKNGDVLFNVSIPGCSDTLFEIYVNIPEGYRITTQPRITVRPELWRSLDAQHVYYFGFVSDR
jgi:hypothetical protein